MKTPQFNRKPYLSIKWQALGLTSLVLGVMFVAILFFISDSTKRQFEISREHIYEQNKEQLKGMVEVSGNRIFQIARLTARDARVQQILAITDQEQIQTQIADLAWNLQIDAGIQDIALYNAQGKMIDSSDGVDHALMVKTIIKNESAQWNLRCDMLCYIEGGAPILVEGEVKGALVLTEALSSVLLRFQAISNINTALLSSSFDKFFYTEFISDWQKNLVALTDPDANRRILDLAAASFTLDELKNSISLVELEERVYELRAFPLANNDAITISEVTIDYRNMEQTREQSIQILLASLFVAGSLLLLVLWPPMNRIRKTASILPLLSERHYVRANKLLRKLRERTLVRDETDVLRTTALTLSAELEELQKQLENRASELETRGNELERERDFVNQLFNTMHAMIIIQDEEGYIKQANQFTHSLSGYKEDALYGSHFAKLLDPSEDTDSVVRTIKRVCKGEQSDYQHEAAIVASNGSLRFLAWRHSRLSNPQTRSNQILSIAVDISARIKAETELAWLANHDSLTGLSNRHCFEQELQACFERYHNDHSPFGVVFIDLDDFKEINDTFGHQKGDEMLQAVADELKRNSRDADFAARMGGDEFALIIRNFQPSDLERLAGRLVDSLTSIKLKPSITCSASVGIAIMKSSVKNIDGLLMNADLAMYQAKERGKNQFVIFSES
jgi:diguanylate cyclase (GGDEF)-like protein/PAS domain S-box-containing protein